MISEVIYEFCDNLVLVFYAISIIGHLCNCDFRKGDMDH